MNRHLKSLVWVMALGGILTSCSSGKRAADTSTVVTPQPPIDQPVDAGYADPSFNEGLFDTTTNNDSPTQGSTTPTETTYSESEIACLGSNQANPPSNYGSYLPQNSDLPQSACMSPQSPYMGQQMYLETALWSFGAMRSCFQLVAAHAPSPVASQQELYMAFSGAKMALVRCFRSILAQQMYMAQWSQPVAQNFQNNDANLYLLLTMFAQQ